MRKEKVFYFSLIILLLVAFAASTLLFFNQTISGSWQEVVSKEGNFSVLMPGTPVEKILTPITANGPLRIETFYFENTINKYFRQIFVAATQDVAEQIRRGRTLQQRLDDGVNGLFLYRKGKIISQREILTSGFQGREVLFRQTVPGNQDAQYLYRVFEARNRCYQLAYGEHGQYPFLKKINSNQAHKFFDSFKLLSSEKNTE